MLETHPPRTRGTRQRRVDTAEAECAAGTHDALRGHDIQVRASGADCDALGMVGGTCGSFVDVQGMKLR
jgi:hypothetical protein